MLEKNSEKLTYSLQFKLLPFFLKFRVFSNTSPCSQRIVFVVPQSIVKSTIIPKGS